MSKRQEWSERDKATIYFDNVTGIAVVNDPVADPEGDDYVFDWTIEFTMDGEYTVRHCYYCSEEEAKHDALIYAKKCWEDKR